MADLFGPRVERITCPLCLAPECARIHEDRLGSYYWCGRCDLRFLDPSCRPSMERERARYLEHNNDVTDPGYRNFVRPLFDHIAASVPRGATGLDFGAGTGPVLADMLAAAGYEIRLFDPFFHPDRRSLERGYDFIIACEVVEHLFDPRAELGRLRALLAEGGLLGVMTGLWTPEVGFADWGYRRDFTHVVFYSQDTFRWIGEYFGFRSVDFPERRIVSLRV